MEQYREKNNFTLWQYPLLIAHLEQMAQKGWMLCQCDEAELVYDKCQPQQVHFAATFFPAYDFLDPVPPPSLERLWDFCEMTGWQHVTDNAVMQIFYNTQPDPMPLETDAVLQLQNFDAVMKLEKVKNWKQSVIINGFYFAFLTVIFIAISAEQSLWRVIGNASPVMVLLVVKNFYSFISDGVKLLGYKKWYKAAKKSAEENNIFLPPQSSETIEKNDIIVATIILAASLFALLQRGELGAVVFWCIPLFGIIGVYIFLMRYMKKIGVPAKDNRFISGMIALIIIILLIYMFLHIIHLMAENGIGESFISVKTVYPS